MTTLTLALVAAAVALAAATRLGLPVAPFAIAAGVLLSLVGGPIDERLVGEGMLLSATFLVFAVGTQLERQALTRYRPAAIGIAVLYLVVTAAIALAMARFVDIDLTTVVFLVLALGSSSTLLVVDLLRRRRQSFDPVGRLTTGVAVTQDAVVIAALALFVPAMAGTSELGFAALGGAGLFGLAWMFARWVAPAALVRGDLSDEEQLLVVLAALFVFMGIAWGAGLPIVLGAYVAGVVFSRFPVGGVVRGHVASFADFFTVLFFVLLGLLVGLPRPQDYLAEGILIATVLVVRPLLLLPILRRLQLTVRASLQAMTMLGQSGELGLIVAVVAVSQGLAGDELLPMVAVVVMVTMAMAPALSSGRVVSWLTHAYPRRRREPPPGRRGHVIVIGAGAGGSVVLEELSRRGADVVVIDDDPAVIDALMARGVPAIRGDGTDIDVLRQAEADRAAAIVSTMRSDHEVLLAHVSGVPVLMRVFSASEAERMRELGGLPVIEAELAAGKFLDWYEEERNAAG
jgi:Kef-type K+ transport system membrane component KefB